MGPVSDKIATYVADVSDKFTGTAFLYRMDPPLTYQTYEVDGTSERITEYVVASAADVMFSGPETYIFPADSDGEVIDWGELEGSFRGDLCCDEAIRRAGYAVS